MHNERCVRSFAAAHARKNTDVRHDVDDVHAVRAGVRARQTRTRACALASRATNNNVCHVASMSIVVPMRFRRAVSRGRARSPTRVRTTPWQSSPVPRRMTTTSMTRTQRLRAHVYAFDERGSHTYQRSMSIIIAMTSTHTRTHNSVGGVHARQHAHAFAPKSAPRVDVHRMMPCGHDASTPPARLPTRTVSQTSRPVARRRCPSSTMHPRCARSQTRAGTHCVDAIGSHARCVDVASASPPTPCSARA